MSLSIQQYDVDAPHIDQHTEEPPKVKDKDAVCGRGQPRKNATRPPSKEDHHRLTPARSNC